MSSLNFRGGQGFPKQTRVRSRLSPPPTSLVSIAGLIGISSYDLSGLEAEHEPTGPWANREEVTSGRVVSREHCGRARKPNNLRAA